MTTGREDTYGNQDPFEECQETFDQVFREKTIAQENRTSQKACG